MDDGIARMGQIVFSNPNLNELRALGLGSCIGLCVIDPISKLGCMAHIVLPQCSNGEVTEPGRYADTAIPHLITEMTTRGAVKSRMKAAIAGGAQLFNFDGATDRLDVGRRNIETVKQVLAKNNLKLIAEDVGGRSGRTVLFSVSTGNVTVKQVGAGETLLANLLKS